VICEVTYGWNGIDFFVPCIDFHKWFFCRDLHLRVFYLAAAEMTKTVTSINGWVKHPERWWIVDAGIEGNFYVISYQCFEKFKRVIYNQDGRPVFEEEWKLDPVKEAGWYNRLRLWWSGRATSAGRR